MNPTPKIPTIVGLILLAVVVGGGIFVTERFTKNISQASESITPKNIEITNITESSLAVSWTTSVEVSGLISINPALGLPTSAFDDRDTEAKNGKYITHHVTARNLSPDTAYTITILSNGKKFQGDTSPWRTTTYQANSLRPSSLEPAYGIILTQEGQPAAGTLVYLTLDGAQTLSTLANTSGSWVIPLTLARTVSGTAFVPSGDRVNETIRAVFDSVASSATTDTLNDAPVPDMTLGKTYDFRKQQGKKQSDTSSLGKLMSENRSILGSQTVAATVQSDISILTPQEGASLSTFLPLISGKGIIGKEIAIELNVPPQSGTTTVGADGTWRFTPKSKLAPGDQQVVIKTENTIGTEVLLTKNFKILKSGTQVLGEATPSGTLVTPTRNPTTTLSPSITPDITKSATSGGTPEPIPTTGNVSSTLILIIFGIFLVSSGALLLYRDR